MSLRAENLEDFFPLLLRLPIGQHFDVYPNELKMQAEGEGVQKLRALFPGQIWEKIKDEDLGWWEYRTTLPNGIKVEIYADRRGPLSCKRVEETITETKEIEVPVTTRLEMREVTRTVVRWECPDGEEESNG